MCIARLDVLENAEKYSEEQRRDIEKLMEVVLTECVARSLKNIVRYALP